MIKLVLIRLSISFLKDVSLGQKLSCSYLSTVMVAASDVVHQRRERTSAQLSSTLYVAYEEGLRQEFSDIANGTYVQWVDHGLVSSGRNAIAPYYRQTRYGELLFDISNSANIVVVYNMSDGERFTLHVSFQPRMMGVHDIDNSYISLYVIGFVDPCHNTWQLVMQSFSDGHCRGNGAKWCPYISSDWEVDTGVSCRDLIPSATFARLDRDPIVLMDTFPGTSYLAYVYARSGSGSHYVNGLPINHGEAHLYWNQTSLETTVQVKSNGHYSMFKVDNYGSLTPVNSSKSLDCPMLNPWLFNCTAYPIFLNSSGSFIPLIHAVGEPWHFTPPGVGSSVVYIREKLFDDGHEVRVCRPDLHGKCQVLPLSEDICDVFSRDAVTAVNDGLELVVTVCGSDRKAFFVPYIFTKGRYVAIKSWKLLPKIGDSIVRMLSFGKPFVSMLPPDKNPPTPSPSHTSELPTVLMSTLFPVVAAAAVCVFFGSITFTYYKIKRRRPYRQVANGDDANQQLLLEMERPQKEDEQEARHDTERGEHSDQIQAAGGIAEDVDCVHDRLDISDFGEGVIMANSQPGEPREVMAEVHDHPLPSSEDRQRNASPAIPQSVPPGDNVGTDTVCTILHLLLVNNYTLNVFCP